MTVFTAADFGLLAGNLIAVTVEAKNAKGYSDPSTANTAGALA